MREGGGGLGVGYLNRRPLTVGEGAKPPPPARHLVIRSWTSLEDPLSRAREGKGGPWPGHTPAGGVRSQRRGHADVPRGVSEAPPAPGATGE